MGGAVPCLRPDEDGEKRETPAPREVKAEAERRSVKVEGERRPVKMEADRKSVDNEVAMPRKGVSVVSFAENAGKEHPSRHDRNSVRTAKSRKAFTQQDLVSDIRRVSRGSLASFVNFVKVPVVLYPLTDESLEKLPENIWSRLGSVDQATYPADMLQSCLGGAIVLQVKDGEPDFYPIRENAFREYKEVSLDQALAKNEELRRFLVQFFGPLSEMPFVQGGMKESAVTMVRLSELRVGLSGIDDDDDDDSPTEVEAPWGGSQFVPPHSDAFVAVPDFERLAQGALDKDPEVYIVQLDASDRPANYMQADTVKPP